MCKGDDMIMNAENYSKDDVEDKMFENIMKGRPSRRGEG
jgi:hypothetical protein